MKLTNTQFQIVSQNRNAATGTASPAGKTEQAKSHWYSLPPKSNGAAKQSQGQSLAGTLNSLQGTPRACTGTVLGATNQGPSIFCMAG